MAVAGKPVAVKKVTLLLPTRQEGMVAEGQGQVRSWLVIELEEDKEEEVQTMPVARAKRRYLEAEVGVKGLVLGKADEGDNNNNNNEDDNRKETPLAKRVAVAKTIAR